MTAIEAAGFAQRLRRETAQAHSDTENAQFVTELLAGRLTRQGYAALLAQSWFVYETLERVGRSHAGDPIAGPFLDDALLRTPALEADLTFLLGPRWRETIAPLPATERYVARLEQVAAVRPEVFLAHHYLRYLGICRVGRSSGACSSARTGWTGTGCGSTSSTTFPTPSRSRTPTGRSWTRRRSTRAGGAR